MCETAAKTFAAAVGGRDRSQSSKGSWKGEEKGRRSGRKSDRDVSLPAGVRHQWNQRTRAFARNRAYENAELMHFGGDKLFREMRNAAISLARHYTDLNPALKAAPRLISSFISTIPADAHGGKKKFVKVGDGTAFSSFSDELKGNRFFLGVVASFRKIYSIHL